MGDLKEYRLGKIACPGQNGQFRTPRPLIRALMHVVQPKIGERICDGTCGSAGFLRESFEYLKSGNANREIGDPGGER
jgi:type I restriction enzyme M protein